MSHKHETCNNPTGEGVICTSGALTGYCDYDECFNEWCVCYGHCGCLCHSGKTCACGFEWPRQEKMKNDNEGGTAS